MRVTICLAAALVLCTGSAPAIAKHAKPAAFEIKHTSWAYVEKGTKVRETVDADGNYISNSSAGKHLDHGTAVMKGGKACFTSAMTKDGEVCWTLKPVAVGHSVLATSDKGKKLRVTRVAYAPLTMPK